MSILQQFRLDNRVALVTGSSRGIGRAIAIALAECGATVVLHGTKSSDALVSALADVRKLSPRSVSVIGDLADPAVPARLIADATAAVGAPDILVINASLQIRKPWQQIPLQEALDQMQVNFHSSFQLIQAAVPAMQAKKWGRILSIGSIQEQRPHPEMPIYAGTKSALENLVRNLARQVGPFGITINNLAPGVIATDRNTDALSNPAYAEQVRQRIPLNYFGAPEDCAGTAILLCSDAGRYITGESIFVDGGMKL